MGFGVAEDHSRGRKGNMESAKDYMAVPKGWAMLGQQAGGVAGTSVSCV